MKFDTLSSRSVKTVIAWGARGRGFKSRRPDHITTSKLQRKHPFATREESPSLLPRFPGFSQVFLVELGQIRDRFSGVPNTVWGRARTALTDRISNLSLKPSFAQAGGL